MPVERGLTEELQESCRRHLRALDGGRFSIQPPKQLESAVERVARRFGHGMSDIATVDRLRRVLERLERVGISALTGGDRFVLAHRFSERLPQYGNEPFLFVTRFSREPLLQWEREAERGELRPTHWRGLFHSYLQAPEGPLTDRLKSILARGLGTLKPGRAGARPWLEVLRRHQGLLGASPCAPYVHELLEGERDLLNDLQSAVQVPKESWFWKSLASEFLTQLERCTDTAFRARIRAGLQLARDLPLSHDDILGAVLDRYARCADRSPQQELLKYSMDAWGSPQLVTRNARWRIVKAETLRMVCGWLAQEDLEDFYRLCQDARQVDEDRLRYWLRFRDQISFTQIVLGSTLAYSRDTDIRQFRERKQGRLGVLTDAIDNNAIILQIGTLVFVEFSQTGNACYPYRDGQVPFDLGIPRFTIHQLKNQESVDASRFHRLVHRGEWQHRIFDPALRSWGVYPDAQASRRR